MKSRVMRAQRYPMYASVERIRIISYIEAALDHASPVIVSTWPNSVMPGIPTVVDTWYPEPLPMRQGGTPIAHLWDCLIFAGWNQAKPGQEQRDGTEVETAMSEVAAW